MHRRYFELGEAPGLDYSAETWTPSNTQGAPITATEVRLHVATVTVKDAQSQAMCRPFILKEDLTPRYGARRVMAQRRMRRGPLLPAGQKRY